MDTLIANERASIGECVVLPLMLREAAWRKGHQSCTLSDYQCDVWSYSLICTCWGCDMVWERFLSTLSSLFIRYLIWSILTKKTQWGEGKWILMWSGKRFIFSSVHRRFLFLCMCSLHGFLIKTQGQCCVCDIKRYACFLIGCVACRSGFSFHIKEVRLKYLFIAWNVFHCTSI